MKKITQENNFAYLCVALIALLFSAAIVQEFPNTWGEEFFSLVLILMLVVSIKSVKTEMAWKGIVYVLTALLVILIVISKFFVFAAMPYLCFYFFFPFLWVHLNHLIKKYSLKER